VVWRGKEGKAYGTTFPPKRKEGNLFTVSQDGEVQAMRPLLPDGNEPPVADAANTLRSILNALPDSMDVN
jgi:hypothetical protein